MMRYLFTALLILSAAPLHASIKPIASGKCDTALVSVSEKVQAAEKLFYDSLKGKIPGMLGEFGESWIFKNAVHPILTRHMKLREAAQIYGQSQAYEGLTYPNRMLKSLEARYEFNEEALNHIPQKGPLILVANHPFGMVEGFSIMSLLERVRPDIKGISTSVIGQIPEVQDYFVVFELYGSDKKAKIKGNFGPLRKVVNWLTDGGAMFLFPAGQVSRFQDKNNGGVMVDRNWHEHIARMAFMSGATILPVYVDGQNSQYFRRAAAVNGLFASALLFRELVNKRGKTIQLQIGEAIRPKDFDTRLFQYQGQTEARPDFRKISDFLMDTTYKLRDELQERLEKAEKERKRQESLEYIRSLSERAKWDAFADESIPD